MQHRVVATIKWNLQRKQGQVKFKDSSASSEGPYYRFRLAKSTCRVPRFGIQYNHRCHWSHWYNHWILGSSFSPHVKESLWLPDMIQMRNMPDTAKDHRNPGMGKGATTSTTTTRPPFSLPGTDLRMDWGDACSLGCLPDLNRYFLLVIDKGTEYFVSFPTKTCASFLALPKQFVTLTGRKICYLRIDSAKKISIWWNHKTLRWKRCSVPTGGSIQSYNESPRGGCEWLCQTTQPNVFVTR